MMIENLIVGDLQTNCYLLNMDNKTIIIDPGDDFEVIKKSINNEVLAVLLTHSHFDHIGAVEDIKKYYNVPVYNYENIDSNVLEIENFKFEIIKNPGHSYDSLSFLFENKLFCGDFIFKGTIGRTDFPTGDMNQMCESILNILKYSDDLIIYPGHGDSTILKYERNTLERFL